MKMITTIRDKGFIYNNCDILDQKQKYKTNNVGLNNINSIWKKIEVRQLAPEGLVCLTNTFSSIVVIVFTTIRLHVYCIEKLHSPS